MSHFFKDETGNRYTRLVVIERVPTPPGRIGAFWRCRCDCGVEKVVLGQQLRAGNTQSCGCLLRENGRNNGYGNRRHGMSGHHKTKEYRAWVNMRQRCTNPRRKDFPQYGGRGITVCDRWNQSFDAFLADMGCAPSPQHSLDRIDNNGAYEPCNCRWATDSEQRRNKRTNQLVTFDGRTQPMADWAHEYGVDYFAFRKRLVRGWSVERALTTPLQTSHHLTAPSSVGNGGDSSF